MTDLPINRFGIAGYYDLWLKPSGQNSPIRVYCLSLPEGFPRGEKLREEVTVTGFYFKRQAYMADDGLRVAPVVLAKTVGWSKPVDVVQKGPSFGVLLAALIGAIAVSLLAVVFVFTRGRPSGAVEAYAARLHKADKVDVDEASVGPGVLESLRQIAQQERSDDDVPDGQDE